MFDLQPPRHISTLPKYSLAAEVHDVASSWIVGAAQMLPKLFFIKIAQDSDFQRRLGPLARSANSSNVRPRMHTPVQHRPVPASTLPSVLAASPSDR